MRPATPHREPEAQVRVVPRQPRRIAGAYQALHGYLDRRYADTAVLTFEQIESLIGFALPDRARTHDDWWASDASDGTDAVASGHRDAWRLAGRTATPNLRAGTVAFDRVPS
jgi:hypothetical protein